MTYWVVKCADWYLLSPGDSHENSCWGSRREDAAKYVTKEDAEEEAQRLEDGARVVRVRSRT